MSRTTPLAMPEKNFAVVHSPEEWAARFGSSGSATAAIGGRRAVACIGNFDGLHLGHQSVLRSTVERARASDGIATVITFDPHPVKVLRPAQALPLIQTLQQRLAGFAALGLDAALVPEIRHRPRGAFRRRIRARHSWRTRYTRQRFWWAQISASATGKEGDVRLLEELGRQFGFAVEIVQPMQSSGAVISSTAIRNAVGDGRVAEAAQLLGRPFALTGTIERGAGRGSTVLVPTLNLAPEQELIPANGVYATETCLGEKLYRSATNIGFRPTFNGTHRSIESHLFDFSDRIMEGRLEVRFWKRLREERKFNSPQELLRQISIDLDEARAFFSRPDVNPTISQRA